VSRNHFRSWLPRSLKVSHRGNSVLPPLLVVATLSSAAVIDCTLGSDSHSATTVVDYNPTVTATIATVYNTIIVVVVTDLNTRIITVTPSVSSVPP